MAAGTWRGENCISAGEGGAMGHRGAKGQRGSVRIFTILFGHLRVG